MSDISMYSAAPAGWRLAWLLTSWAMEVAESRQMGRSLVSMVGAWRWPGGEMKPARAGNIRTLPGDLSGSMNPVLGLTRAWVDNPRSLPAGPVDPRLLRPPDSSSRAVRLARSRRPRKARSSSYSTALAGTPDRHFERSSLHQNDQSPMAQHKAPTKTSSGIERTSK